MQSIHRREPSESQCEQPGKATFGTSLPKEFGNLGGGQDGGNAPTSLGVLGLFERLMGVAAAKRNMFLHLCAMYLPCPLLKHDLHRAV